MPNTNYNRGSAYERQLQKYFESRGWFAMRSAGSHTPVDLIVLAPTEIFMLPLLIQCKVSRYYPDVKRLLEGTNVKALERLRGERFIFHRNVTDRTTLIFYYREAFNAWSMLPYDGDLYTLLTRKETNVK